MVPLPSEPLFALLSLSTTESFLLFGITSLVTFPPGFATIALPLSVVFANEPDGDGVIFPPGDFTIAFSLGIGVAFISLIILSPVFCRFLSYAFSILALNFAPGVLPRIWSIILLPFPVNADFWLLEYFGVIGSLYCVFAVGLAPIGFLYCVPADPVICLVEVVDTLGFGLDGTVEFHLILDDFAINGLLALISLILLTLLTISWPKSVDFWDWTYSL